MQTAKSEADVFDDARKSNDAQYQAARAYERAIAQHAAGELSHDELQRYRRAHEATEKLHTQKSAVLSAAVRSASTTHAALAAKVDETARRVAEEQAEYASLQSHRRVTKAKRDHLAEQQPRVAREHMNARRAQIGAGIIVEPASDPRVALEAELRRLDDELQVTDAAIAASNADHAVAVKANEAAVRAFVNAIERGAWEKACDIVRQLDGVIEEIVACRQFVSLGESDATRWAALQQGARLVATDVGLRFSKDRPAVAVPNRDAFLAAKLAGAR